MNRQDIVATVINEARCSQLFQLLKKSSEDRSVTELMQASEAAVRKTPVEELCILVAALAAFVPAGSLGGCEKKAGERVRAQSQAWNRIYEMGAELGEKA